MRQEFRNKLLATTTEDIARATRYALAPHLEKSIIVSLANQEIIEKENGTLQNPLPIIPI